MLNLKNKTRCRLGFSQLLLLLGIGLTIAAVLVTIFFSYGGKDGDEQLVTYKVTRNNMTVTVIEQGTLESSENTEIKCQVRGKNTITSVIESGTRVKKGDTLLQLDTLALEEAITERKKFALLTTSSAERLKASVESAKYALEEYKKGTFVSDKRALEKDLLIAKSNLKAAQNLYQHEEKLVVRGFRQPTQLNVMKISVDQYLHQVKKLEEDIFVLEEYTRKEQLATLIGDLEATQANYDAEAERAITDAGRRDQAVSELDHCVVRAPRDGLVIHPSAAQWEGAPDIEEGATVHKTQVMLLMPDLDKMQVKVGIHESVVDRVKKGMKAMVVLNDREIEATVFSVARITKPAGWWTGNVVKYDTIIKIPEKEPNLKPGMSAEVQVILANYEDIVTAPVAAILQTKNGDYCWVKKGGEIKRRLLELGDSNDVFVHVKSGLEVDDEIILNPLAHISEAERESLVPTDDEDEKKEVSGSGEQKKE